jgi:chromosome segregation ATPase
MMKQIRVLTSVVSLGLLLSLTGCSEGVKSEGVRGEGVRVEGAKSEVERVLGIEQDGGPDSLTLDLQRAEAEEQDLIARMETVTRASDYLQKQLRTKLQKEVDSLAQSRDGLREQIDELTKSRSELRERIDELMRSRDVAAAEAHKAQKQRDALQSQLEAEAKTVSQLKDQLEQIRELQGTIEKLQSELAKVVKDGSPASGSATADSGDSGDSGDPMVVDAPAGPN